MTNQNEGGDMSESFTSPRVIEAAIAAIPQITSGEEVIAPIMVDGKETSLYVTQVSTVGLRLLWGFSHVDQHYYIGFYEEHPPLIEVAQ